MDRERNSDKEKSITEKREIDINKSVFYDLFPVWTFCVDYVKMMCVDWDVTSCLLSQVLSNLCWVKKMYTKVFYKYGN